MRLKCRINKEKYNLSWMVEDNTTVYSNIRDVQDEYDTKLSSNSHIVVILENPENGNEIGKRYTATKF